MARPRRRIKTETHIDTFRTFSDEYLSVTRGLFTPVIRKRGKSYFDNQRVRFDSLDETGVNFRAQGNAGRYYSVFLSGRNISLSSCDCPFTGYCKHIWAALLTAVDEGIPLGLEEPDEFFPESSDFPGEPKTSAISELPERKSWVASMLRDPIPTRIKESKKQYQLIFLMGVYGIRFRNPEIYVRPSLRYIKKNGDPGAVSEFRDSAALKDPGSAELMLLNACLRYEGKRLDLHTALGYFLGEQGITVYKDSPKDSVKIRFLRPEKIEVDFEPEYLDGEVLFHPLIILKSSGEEDCTLLPDYCSFDFQGARKFLFYPLTGILALIPLSDLREIRILDLLGNTHHKWQPGDIDELIERMPEGIISPAEISTDVRITEGKPGIILEILDMGKSLILTFSFDESDFPDVNAVRHDEGYWELSTINYESAVDEARNIAENIGGIMDEVSHLRLDIPLSEFLRDKAAGLLEKGIELRLGRNGMRIRRPSDFRIESKSGIDWLELNVSIDHLERRLDGFNPAGRLFHTGSDYILLDDEQLEKLLLLEQLPADASGGVRFHPDDIGTVQILGSLADEFDDSRLERTREIIARLKKGFEYQEKPAAALLKAELRDYQKTGLEWLRFLKTFNLGGILADDMGLGKTVQTIALLADAVETGEWRGPFLVVAPLSTIPNWAAEFSRFLPGMVVKVHVGNNRGELEENPEGVVLTTYQILQRDSDAFASVEWKLLCIDESQNIKNSSTKTFKAVHRLSAVHTLALSGTPIENSVMELWSVMEIVNPGLLGPRERFKRRYLNSSKEGDVKRMGELRKRVAPFILRRTKDVVAGDLPSKEEIVRTITLAPSERRFYDRLKKDLRDEVKRIISEGRRDISAANAVLLALLRLRQAAISPALLGEKPESSSKIDEVLYLLETLLAEDHKVLIFSQFVKVLDILRGRLEGSSIEYAYLDGSLSLKARESAIRTFKNEKSVFLISLKAGGTGLNLTEADYVFILDPWWNPAVESQAIDRTHRIGQNRPVIAYKFISSDTVEEHILELQESKRKIAEDILGFDSSIISRMDTGEILKLFS